MRRGGTRQEGAPSSLQHEDRQGTHRAKAQGRYSIHSRQRAPQCGVRFILRQRTTDTATTPSEDRLKIIDAAIEGQTHLTGEQKGRSNCGKYWFLNSRPCH